MTKKHLAAQEKDPAGGQGRAADFDGLRPTFNLISRSFASQIGLFCQPGKAFPMMVGLCA